MSDDDGLPGWASRKKWKAEEINAKDPVQAELGQGPSGVVKMRWPRSARPITGDSAQNPNECNGDISTLILVQMGQSCSLFFANALQFASRLTANLPARYTFPSAGQILEARRTVKERG